MKQDDLIRMTNQIADFFQSYPQAQAVEAIATHIKDFWDPRMKGQIGDMLSNNADQLKPLAIDGLKKCIG
ncbi:MAG: formate dehydrogenase subunit delta [Cohaesibacter sp.]|nr:formate dehydrogenase subunit delta [Cohaesibacter sp.]MCV6601499.1 formate dehydrogenase subunit delta [Cohaesibacter sp.]